MNTGQTYQVKRFVWDGDRYYPVETIGSYDDELTAWHVAQALAETAGSEYVTYRVVVVPE